MGGKGAQSMKNRAKWQQSTRIRAPLPPASLGPMANRAGMIFRLAFPKQVETLQNRKMLYTLCNNSVPFLGNEVFISSETFLTKCFTQYKNDGFILSATMKFFTRYKRGIFILSETFR